MEEIWHIAGMKMKHKDISNLRGAVNYRLKSPQYEYLARCAYSQGHRSITRVINQRVFKGDWRQELQLLREQHAKLKVGNEIFLHAEARRALGLPVKMGRPRKLRPAKAA